MLKSPTIITLGLICDFHLVVFVFYRVPLCLVPLFGTVMSS